MIVYCAQSLSGKVYVGYTSWTLAKRKRSHQTSFENGRPGKIYSAFTKYGFESFTWFTLRICIDLNEAKKWEQFYIKFFNSKDDGYNLTEGGEGTKGYVWSDKLKQQQSGFAKKQFSTAEGKKKCSEGQKKRWTNEEERLKQAERIKKQYSDPVLKQRLIENNRLAISKQVEVFENDIFVFKFKSISDAARTMLIKREYIGQCLSGKRTGVNTYSFRQVNIRKS